MIDPLEVATGVSTLVLVPALVEVAKQLGLPVRFAGLAAIALAVMLVALGDIAAGNAVDARAMVRWCLGGVVYGLAAAGLYSQTRVHV